MSEKRKSRRIELDSKIMIKCLNGTTDPQEATIDIINVSKTGIGFRCESSLGIGTVYEAFLTIWTKEVLHAFIEIVRIDKDEEGFLYGGIFIGMSEMDAVRIAIYGSFNSDDDEEE